MRFGAGCGIAGAGIIDLVRPDETERDQGRDAQGRRGDKNRAHGEISADQSHQRRGRGVAAGRIAVVAPGAHRHRPAADQTEADGAYRRRDNPASHALQQRGEQHHEVGWRQRQDQRRGADHDNADRDQSALPWQCVGQRAARDLAGDPRKPAKRQGIADVALRPAQMGQIERNEGAEAGLHVGKEEIHPVEAVAALRRRRAMQRLSGVVVARYGVAHPAQMGLAGFRHRNGFCARTGRGAAIATASREAKFRACGGAGIGRQTATRRQFRFVLRSALPIQRGEPVTTVIFLAWIGGGRTGPNQRASS